MNVATNEIVTIGEVGDAFIEVKQVDEYALSWRFSVAAVEASGGLVPTDQHKLIMEHLGEIMDVFRVFQHPLYDEVLRIVSDHCLSSYEDDGIDRQVIGLIFFSESGFFFKDRDHLNQINAEFKRRSDAARTKLEFISKVIGFGFKVLSAGVFDGDDAQLEAIEEAQTERWMGLVKAVESYDTMISI